MQIFKAGFGMGSHYLIHNGRLSMVETCSLMKIFYGTEHTDFSPDCKTFRFLNNLVTLQEQRSLR